MIKFKYLNNQDRWMLAEHIPGINFFFAEIWLSSFVNNLKNSGGLNYKKVLAVFQPKFYLRYYFSEKDSSNLEKDLVERMKKNTEFGFLINKNIILWSDKLKKFSEKLSRLNLKKLTNQELSGLLKGQDVIHTHLYEWGWLSNTTDMFHGSFTNELRSYLNKNNLARNSARSLSEIFSILTMPSQKSVVAEEEKNLLKIAALIKNKSSKQTVQNLINQHHARYCHLKYLWLGTNGIYSKSYYFKLAKRLAQDKIAPKTKLIEAGMKLKQIRKEKEKFFKELKVEEKYKKLFQIYSDFMLTKMYRRYAQIFWAYVMGKLLKEISHRLNLTLDEVRYLSVVEIQAGLLNGKLNKKEISQRLVFCFYYAEEGKEITSSDQGHPIVKNLKLSAIKKTNELVGQIGCLGRAKGVVRIINSQKDLAKMKAGNILVSIATNPDLVPAMKKAAAIVTEQGGVTSHAAIVSRELGIPCVIGTKVATQVLKDGDKVEVDANKGIVRKL